MLTTSQKITLIKKVGSHALTSERIRALGEIRTSFNVEDSEEIGDMVYLKTSTVRMILS